MGARWSIALLAFTLTEKDYELKQMRKDVWWEHFLMNAQHMEFTMKKIQKLKHGIEFELSIRWAAQGYEVQRWIDHQKKSNEKNKC